MSTNPFEKMADPKNTTSRLRPIGRQISGPVQNWLSHYCLELMRAEDQKASSIVPASLKSHLVRLEIEAEGDYTEQFARLQTRSGAAASELTLAELSSNYRCTILLGRAGSGKTYQLHDLLIRQARQTLAQLEQARQNPDGSWRTASPLIVPIYLNLSELANAADKSNLFQAALEAALPKTSGNLLPDNWLNEVAPLLLVDDLEQLEPGLAPLFFYKFNQWLGQTVPAARAVVSCRYLSFSLYHPWFKAEQQWQFYALSGFSWEDARLALAEHLAATEIDQMEQTRLTWLFSNPALTEKLLQHRSENKTLEGLPGLLQAFLDVVFEKQSGCVLELSRHSVLLTEKSVTPPGNSDECFGEALALGILEKHPVAGWLRLVDPSLDRLLAAWFCLGLEGKPFTSALDQILEVAAMKGSDWQLSFLKLLYLLTAPAQRPVLFTALLGQPPAASRLDLLIALEPVAPNFVEEWRTYLEGLVQDTNPNGFGRQVLELAAKLGRPADENGNPPVRERVLLAEVALALLVSSGQADPTLHLEMGRVQEQLGKPAEAQASYRRAQQNADLPALEGTLGIARLLTQDGAYGEADAQLIGLSKQLANFQAEIDNQLSVVKRSQHDFEAALTYAQQALQRGDRPAYRHNLALALYEKGERAKAEPELLKLTEDYPAFAEGFYDLGRVQLERGASDLALANFHRAVELSSTTAPYLYNLGRSLMGQGRHAEAYTYLQAAAAQSTGQPAYQIALGLVALKLNRYDEARTAFGKALELSQDKPTTELLVYLAATEYATENFAAASANLERALTLEPRNTSLNLITGLVAEADDKIEAALGYYRQATALGQEHAGFPLTLQLAWNLGMSRCLRLTKKPDEAIPYCMVATELAPGSPETLYEAGQLALTRKAYQEAANFFSNGVSALTRSVTPNAGETATSGSTLISANPTNSLSGTDWLTLFSGPDKLRFELPFYCALALRELGQHVQAQKVLHLQLKTLSSSKLSPNTLVQQKAILHHQLGLSLLATHDNQEALHFLGLAVADEPKNASYHLGFGRALIASGNPERALYELNQARDLDPALAEVYAEIAELQLTGKAAAQTPTLLLSSLNLYSKALEADPGNPDYLYRAALLAYHLRYQNQATELLGRLLKESGVRSPESVVESLASRGQTTDSRLRTPDSKFAGEMVYLLAACNFERAGELLKARAEIKLALTSGKPEAYVVAARLARKAGVLSEMEQILSADLTQALSAKPAGEVLALQSALRAEQGWLAMAQKSYPAAAQFYQEAIAFYEQFRASGTILPVDALYQDNGAFGQDNNSYDQLLLASYRVAYASALLKDGKPQQLEQVLSQLDQAIKLNPHFVQAHSLRGELLIQRGTYRAALESLKKAAELEPTPARFYELALLYLRVDETALAIEALEQAGGSREISGKPEYYSKLGQAYEKTGDYKAARGVYTRGLQIDPQNATFYQALAHCYLNDGERLAAVQPLQGAVVSAPANPVYRLELARLYEELGWWQEAASEYEQATLLTPKEPEVWLKRGQALLRVGQGEPARAALEQALKLDDNLAEAHYEIGQLYLKTYELTLDEQAKLPPDLNDMFGAMPGEANSK